METQTQAQTATTIDPHYVMRTGRTFFLRPQDIRVTAEFNPRRFSIPAKRIAEMADSLLEKQIQPVGLRPSNDPADPRPMLVFGYTRHAAAMKLSEEGLGDGQDGAFLLECTWDEASDQEAFTRALRENNDRNDSSRIDRAHNIQQLISEFGLTQTECGKLLGVSPATVTQDLKLLKLIPKIQRMVHDGKMAADAALEISGKTPEEQEEILQLLKSRGKTTRADAQAAAEDAQDEGEGEGEDGGGGKPGKPDKPQFKPKSTKTVIKTIREMFSHETLSGLGWVDESAIPIADFWEAFASWASGSPLKGRRKPCDLKDLQTKFDKMLGTS